MITDTDDTMGSVAVPDLPEIVRASRSISIVRDDQTAISYYLLPEFEINYCVLPPGATQGWHHHKKLEEVLFITQGEMEVWWLDEARQKQSSTLHAGDLCRVGRSTHTTANRSKEPVTFIAFRLVPDGTNKHELMKHDRYAEDVKTKN